MKLVASVSIAFALLVGVVAFTAGGSSSDGDKVRNAAFAASDDLREPGITDDEYRDLIGKMGTVSLSEYDCLKLDRQDDKRVRFNRFAQIEDVFDRRVDILRRFDDGMRSQWIFKDLYYRLELLDDLKLLRPYRDAWGGDVETFRDLKDYDDLLDRIESLDLNDTLYLFGTQELLDRLREKCE